jgi:nicotinamidase-related amidase
MSVVAHLDLMHSQLLVVDMQCNVLPHIDRGIRVVAAAQRAIRAAHELNLDITVTEQMPDQNGRTHPLLTEAAQVEPQVQKRSYSVCADPAAREILTEHLRPHVLIVGIEAHVSVQQTALDLIEMQMQPIVLADAVGSRRAFDREMALDYMRSLGVGVTTVEAAIMALLHSAGTERFRKLLPLITG